MNKPEQKHGKTKSKPHRNCNLVLVPRQTPTGTGTAHHYQVCFWKPQGLRERKLNPSQEYEINYPQLW